MAPIAKALMITGGVIFAVGLLLLLGKNLGLGQLPGDIALRRGNTSFFFPVATSIILSVVLTIVLNLVMRFFR